MPDYALQKDLIQVSLRMHGQRELLEGELYKDVAFPGSDIKYAVENYLHRAPQFMPFKDQQANFWLLNKENIVYLKLLQTPNKNSQDTTDAKRVRIYLDNDEILTGNTCKTLSERKQRISDYVNQDTTFVLINADNLNVYINKAYVLKITESTRG